ncbi:MULTISPECIES: hypothetical protein [unclassified Pseudoalteromonas]|uniref:hypothetical protein n=1 Tax=unclassified Pseudoalteromonas TaxID=194690 RepID=UPI0005A6F839|nr:MULTISPECIES: hypothetical protein [unclassified Pseudoalteromonas]
MTELEFKDINSITKELIDNKSAAEHFEQYDKLFKNMFDKAQSETDDAMYEIARLNKLRA